MAECAVDARLMVQMTVSFHSVNIQMIHEIEFDWMNHGHDSKAISFNVTSCHHTHTPQFSIVIVHWFGSVLMSVKCAIISSKEAPFKLRRSPIGVTPSTSASRPPSERISFRIDSTRTEWTSFNGIIRSYTVVDIATISDRISLIARKLFRWKTHNKYSPQITSKFVQLQCDKQKTFLRQSIRVFSSKSRNSCGYRLSNNCVDDHDDDMMFWIVSTVNGYHSWNS